MRHVPISILGIIAVFGIAILILSVGITPDVIFYAIQFVPSPSAPSSGETIIINLDIGEYISNELTAISGAQLSALSSGSVHGKSLSTDFTQSLRFAEPGTFMGGHVAFGKDEQNRVSDFLQFNSDDGIFKYQVDFGSGLQSSLDGGKMNDIIGEDVRLLGETFSIVDANYNPSTNAVELKLFGGFGSVVFRDNNAVDDIYYTGGVQVNGQNVPSRLKVKATMAGGKPTIYSIQYVLDANAVQGGDVQVLPLHCVRQYLQYPQGMLVPNFDICYKGLGAAAVGVPAGGISGNEVRVRTTGGDELVMNAPNSRGQMYRIPLAQMPGAYGNKGRNFVFVEAPAPGAPNIALHDYFLVNSKNDINGVSNVLQYDTIDTTNHQVVFKDLAGAVRQATYDAGTMQGDLLVGEGTYRFVIGPGNMLAVDQTNDGSITGAEARFVLPGGSMMDFGPGFTVTVTTPSRLFSEPMGNENTIFTLTFAGHAGLFVPSPQATVPGYTFTMLSAEGGVKQALTKWGILFTWHHDSNEDDLKLTVPGAYSSAVKGGATGNVYITFNPALKKPVVQTPAAPPKCGDSLITKPEYCDPPGSVCADQFKRTGVCAPDCLSCEFTSPALCGNHLLEKGEQCEANADCAVGFACSGCKCLPLPKPVCGNRLLDQGEQCEAAVDCGAGYNCINCFCSPMPLAGQAPAPVAVQPNVFARFFSWIARLFGG